MTKEELTEIGERLFGPKWQTPLARALFVTPRAVRKWKSGEVRITERTAEQVRGLMEKSDDRH